MPFRLLISGFTRQSQVVIAAITVAGCVSPQGETEDLAFTGAEGDRLQGTLVVPADATPPLPAIIVLHGSEQAKRDRMYYMLLANLFTEYGLAVFVYDKRGVGDSEGDHDTKTYAHLVEDAVAAVAAVKAHPSIDPERVGLFGISESGWLTPEIAERSDAAFVINKVGSALSVRETLAWEVYNELLDDWPEDMARRQADTLLRLWNYHSDPVPAEREALDRELADWQDVPDTILPERVRDAGEAYLADISYDPGPFLERTETPFLYLFGTEDVNVPTRASVRRLDELIAAGRPIEYRVFEGEGHELGGPAFRPPFYAFADGFAAVVADFAEARSR